VKSVSKIAIATALTVALAGGTGIAVAQHEHGGGEHGGGESRPAPPHPPEEHAGPNGYDRVNEPHGWNARPQTVDRGAYQHNFKAARSYHIGPYHRPPGWAAHRWAFGQILPRAYWGPSYLIADYWLFALEVPPAGYEWVRDDTDALLVNTSSGEILQVEYGAFG
jgi:Ni/Co efflux regulator RcnB